ncbi:6213_t:CDS:2 [Gigaspora margarita]|uniref:6213_t:CDS:1 n=1 Tax=Gigaspora margarita TaxID=4874 RepID=A0ABM8W3A7_GIGMA|nr:6213_t:CDS:2 [Gigaspora margarita]
MATSLANSNISSNKLFETAIIEKCIWSISFKNRESASLDIIPEFFNKLDGITINSFYYVRKAEWKLYEVPAALKSLSANSNTQQKLVNHFISKGRFARKYKFEFF